MGIVQIGQRRETLNLFSITNSFVCLLDLINLARITHRIGYTDTYTCVVCILAVVFVVLLFL